jgi:hypothetical protein
MNDIAHKLGNLFFIAFGVALIAFAFFAPPWQRGMGGKSSAGRSFHCRGIGNS